MKNTHNFINNANRCEFSDVRDGVNPKARYSFKAFGKLRPAYYLTPKNNKSVHDF